MSDCLFCGIVAGSIPATIVDSDDDTVAFRDINPQAPTHVLIVPRRHLPSAAAVSAEDLPLWSSLLLAAQRVAEAEGVGERGYRLVTNVGTEGGQTVEHLHLHLLGGRPLLGRLG